MKKTRRRFIICRAESRAARAVKLSASRSVQQQRRFVPAVQAKSPQLAISQLPNRFSRVNQQQSSQRSASVFVLRVANLAIGELRVPFCSRRMPCSLPSDSLMLSLTRISTFNQWISIKDSCGHRKYNSG